MSYRDHGDVMADIKSLLQQALSQLPKKKGRGMIAGGKKKPAKKYQKQVPKLGGGDVDMEKNIQDRANAVRELKGHGMIAGGKKADLVKAIGKEMAKKGKKKVEKVAKKARKAVTKMEDNAEALLEKLLKKVQGGGMIAGSAKEHATPGEPVEGSGMIAGGLIAGGKKKKKAKAKAKAPAKGGSKMKRRGALIKKLMKEKNMTLAQASKHIKEAGLTY